MIKPLEKVALALALAATLLITTTVKAHEGREWHHYNTWNACQPLMDKMPEGVELVDLKKNKWERQLLTNKNTCLVAWDTFTHGVDRGRNSPPSLNRLFGCQLSDRATFKYLPNYKELGINISQDSGYKWKYFWICPQR